MVKRLVYQAWKGNNIFVCGGRLVFGPDVRSLFITIFLILVPVITFCTLVATKLIHEFQAESIGYAILGVTIGFTVFVLVLLLLTSARDPGIIPRNSHPPEEETGYDSTSVDGNVRTPTPRLPRTKDVIINGTPVKVKYCDTCMLYRPPRCSHCSICNNCVDRFDHHCPWVGQCVGLRNYRHFFLFVSSAALLCIFVFGISALYLKFLVDDLGTVWKAMRASPASVVLIVYCFLALWFVGGLTGFHMYLIGTNQTTYENFRYREENRRSTYSRGCLKNYGEVFCGKIESSKINFRAHVEYETQSTPKGLVRPAEIYDISKGQREKVEDDVLNIGMNLPNISQRHIAEEGEEIQG